jgi:hypothetical protein
VRSQRCVRAAPASLLSLCKRDAKAAKQPPSGPAWRRRGAPRRCSLPLPRRWLALRRRGARTVTH